MSVKRLESISASEFSAGRRSASWNIESETERLKIEKWFEALLSVQHSAHAKHDLFQVAANSLVEFVGLDQAWVLQINEGHWKIEASTSAPAASGNSFCVSMLEKVAAEKQTLFESMLINPDLERNEIIDAHVATPVLSASGEVQYVLSGHRSLKGGHGQPGIHRAEALFVALIAGTLAAGLTQHDRQSDASRFEVQLEQFTSPKLVEAMKHDPGILEAREREITVLFSDIRGFTGLTERVGAEKTFTMIRNLMNQLTGCILDEEGFIMGYAGDGIAAMWNAPADQPDHAELACWAAVNMQKVMAKLSQFWNFITGEILHARIGICTGIAHVGNAGSRWRLNYSALGPCVNFASRLEGANKYFGSSILIAESTQRRLFSKFDMRRIGPVGVKGIDHVEQVFELLGECTNSLPPYFERYEVALEQFERGNLDEARRLIDSAIEQNENKDLAAFEMRTQIEHHFSRPELGSPAIRLSSK